MLRRMGPVRASVVVLAVSALAVTGCSASAGNSANSSNQVTVTSCGLDMSFPQPLDRVVTLDQSSTETLLALGLQDRMAGTANLKTKVAPQYQAAYDEVPVLNPKKLTAEQLRAANPHAVVSSFSALYTKDQVGTREELKQLDVPTYVSAVDCPSANSGKSPFDLLLQDYENFGKIFAVQDQASALMKEQQEALARAAEIKPKMTGEPSIVWLYSTFNGIPYVAGNGGMPSAMSKLVGARNAFDDVNQQWPEVSWEQIAQRNPDVIIVGDLSERGAPGDSADEKLTMMRQDPVVSQLTALRENKVIKVSGIEMDPSVRTVNTLQATIDGLRGLGYVR